MYSILQLQINDLTTKTCGDVKKTRRFANVLVLSGQQVHARSVMLFKTCAILGSQIIYLFYVCLFSMVAHTAIVHLLQTILRF